MEPLYMATWTLSTRRKFLTRTAANNFDSFTIADDTQGVSTLFTESELKLLKIWGNPVFRIIKVEGATRTEYPPANASTIDPQAS